MSKSFRMAARSRSALVASSASLLLAATSVSLAGPDWDLDLTDDAGKTLLTAQAITTGGSISTIAGNLGNYPLTGASDGQDLYLVYVDSPLLFRVSTVGIDGGSAGFNASLFAFAVDYSGGDAAARALLGNTSAFVGTTDARLVQSTNDGTNIKLESPGLYLIGIALDGTYPINSLFESIFGDNLSTPGLVVGPSSAVSSVLFDWGGTGGPGGSYVMTVQGISGTLVPAPGAIALLGLAGLRLRRRR